MSAPSQRRIEANRRNARRSTGPRTSEGKERSRLNAVSHGLSAQLSSVIGPDDIARLASLLVPQDADEATRAAAWRLAQAEVLLDRCRAARAAIAAQAVGPDDEATRAAAIVEATAKLSAIDRYERRARREMALARKALETP